MTDSGLGGIVVLNLNTGQARSVLGNNSSTKAEPIILEVDGRPLVYVDGSSARFNSDGIALDSQGQYLYYHALTGRTLYRIRTDYLRDSTLNESQIASRVEKLGQDCATDGMIMDRAGNLYLTCVEENAIMARQFSGSSNSPALMIVAQDQRLQWPDSMSIGSDGYLYVTASQFHLIPIIAEGKDLRKSPYMIFKVRTI
jgi:sugar lactone lactonase YvrE